MTSTSVLTVGFLMAVQSYPGSTGPVANGAGVCSGGVTGNHQCIVSPVSSLSSLLHPGCPLLLKYLGSV